MVEAGRLRCLGRWLLVCKNRRRVYSEASPAGTGRRRHIGWFATGQPFSSKTCEKKKSIPHLQKSFFTLLFTHSLFNRLIFSIYTPQRASSAYLL